MVTSFHIMAAVERLKEEILDAKIVSTEFYRKERSAFLIIKNQRRKALGMMFHPTKNGLVYIEASKIKMDTPGKPWPIFNIKEADIISVEQVDFDRLIKIGIKHDNENKYLLIEALGVNGNIWLLNEKEEKLATLRNREFIPNEKYYMEPVKGKLNPLSISVDELNKIIAADDDSSPIYFIKNNILGCSLTLSREIIHRSGVDCDEISDATDEDKKKIIDSIKSITRLFKEQNSGYLYPIGGKFEAYPFKLSSQEQMPEKFKTLSLALLAMAERKQTGSEEEDKQKSVSSALKKSLKRLVKRREKIVKDVEIAENFDEYKKQGELLKINFDKIKKGLKDLEVVDIYSDEQNSMKIKLDPTLSPNENVERYFKKFRKGREGLELLKRRLSITDAEIESSKKMLEDFENDFESSLKQYAAELASILPKEGVKSVQIERLPYKAYTLSTGLTIFVGRDGSDNGRTTFDYGRPYELWFHTQQCPGSHVVMKFPNKKFEPSKREIEETAAIAAFFSKARNDSLVPVIYAERKYVRKPRKAKAGLVTVEREKSVMVIPTKPE